MTRKERDDFYAGFTTLRVARRFKVGDRVRLIGKHPWAGETGEIVAFEYSPADQLLGKPNPAIVARVKLLRGDAMNGHECYAKETELL